MLQLIDADGPRAGGRIHARQAIHVLVYQAMDRLGQLVVRRVERPIDDNVLDVKVLELL